MNVTTPPTPEVPKQAQPGLERGAPGAAGKKQGHAAARSAPAATTSDVGDITAHDSSGTESGDLGGTGATVHEVAFSITDVRYFTGQIDNPPANIGVTLQDSSGSQVAEASTADGTLALSAVLEAGSYRLRISLTDTAATSYALAYRVDGNVDERKLGADVSNNSSTLGRIEPGGSFKGNIFEHPSPLGPHWAGQLDWDWIVFVAVEGRTYRVSLHQAHDGPNGPLVDRHLDWMRDENLVEINGTYDDTDGWHGSEPGARQIWYRATSTGTRYLVVTGEDGHGLWAVGDYELRVDDVTPPYDHPADTSTTARATPGGSAVTLYADGLQDEDWVAMTLEAGVSYRITLRKNNNQAKQHFTGLRFGSDPAPLASTLIAGEGTLVADGGVNSEGDRVVGYSAFRTIPGGSVAHPAFQHNDEWHWVQLLALITGEGTPTLYLGLEPEDNDLTLYVNGKPFPLADAQTFTGGTKIWHWPALGMSWEQGEQIEVALR